MAIAYIGIGSNLGKKEENCLHALELLQRRGIIVKKRSSLYDAEPWGIKEQPRFINMAVEIETRLEPKDLLGVFKEIEKGMGRKESVRWGPRIIDLDILLFEDMVLKEEDLEIPHPLMHERDFVLRPLCEIAPDRVHPLLKMRICDLMQRLVKS